MLRSIHLLTLAATVAATPAVTTPRAAHAEKQEIVLGYVNLQRAILEVDEGKRAKAALKTEFEKKQKLLNQKEEELMRLKGQIEAKASVSNDDATRTQVLEFQNKLMELKQVYVKEQQALQEKEQEALSGITEKMRKIVQEIGTEGKYTLILEVQDSRLLYAKPHLDLTNEVIRKYNARHK